MPNLDFLHSELTLNRTKTQDQLGRHLAHWREQKEVARNHFLNPPEGLTEEDRLMARKNLIVIAHKVKRLEMAIVRRVGLPEDFIDTQRRNDSQKIRNRIGFQI